jgi:hypothetical protein
MNITLLTITRGQKICRAPDPLATAIQDMSVDHRCADVAMPEQLLDGPNVVTIFE